MPANPFKLKDPYSTAYNPDSEELLYSLDNPDYAITNAMQDLGVNPYAANPFTNAVRKRAGSLQNSYKLTQAIRPNQNTPEAVTNIGRGGPNSSMAFSDYLRYNLAGVTGSQKYTGYDYSNPGHGPNADPQTAAHYIPHAARAIRDYRNNLAAGNVNFQNINPFLASLSEQWGANGGMGTADFIAQMMAPSLAPSMAQAYNRALRASATQAIRTLANEGPGSPNDIWTYLLGI